MSKSAAARLFGFDRKSVSKMLEHFVPSGYRRSRPRAHPKLKRFVATIDQILASDRWAPKTQRHLAKRIFERLRDEPGCAGGVTIVTDYVWEKKRRTSKVFVPLAHPPGHAQVEFGEALALFGVSSNRANQVLKGLSVLVWTAQMVAFSNDLRVRLVKAVEARASRRQVAARFEVSHSAVIKLVRRQRRWDM